MLTAEQIAIGDELERIFMPLAYSKRKKMCDESRLFVHYTSAENAVKILTSKRIWLRNARCMNDYSEAYFGHEQLVRIFNNKELKADFEGVLEPYGKDTGNRVLKHFDEWWLNIQFNTFICSISEHEASENIHGRLSMWRAYGGNSAKAALVLRIPLVPGRASGLRLLLSPVEYFSYEETEDEFKNALQNIRDNSGMLAKVDPDFVFNMAFYMLVLTALCLKHKGFREEKEWRIICLPQALPSENIERSVEVIGGIPQIVHKIPLENNVEKQIDGVSLPDLIERVIVGPSVYPMPIFDAFSHILLDCGISDAATRLAVSDIPLRT